MTRDDIAPGLHWPIKRSFVMYVAKVADGQVYGKDVQVAASATFVFPPGTGTDPLAFAGEVIFQAHAGALYVRIANPRVHVDGARGSITIDDPTMASGGGPPLTLVTFVATSQPAPAGHLAWTGSNVRLTTEALPVFSLYYGEGEAFDDLTVVTPARPAAT